MGKISIFLGTSASLMELRTKIGSRIRQVNDRLMPQGVQVVLNKWEDYKAEYTGDSKQLEYDRDLVLQSDIIVAVFKHHVGEWTAHELDVAIEDGKKVIYCYCLPCQEREEVIEKLKAKGLTPIEVDSKAAVMDSITNAVNKHAHDKGLLTGNPSTVADVVKAFYGTIPSDMKGYRGPFSDMIRSLDMTTTQFLNIHCILHPYRTPALISQTNHYVALFCTRASEDDIAELHQAIANQKSKGSVEAISIFQKKIDDGSNIRDAVPEIKKIVDDNVIFTIGMGNMDKVRLVLLLWCLRQHEAAILPTSTEFSLVDGSVAFYGVPVADIENISELNDIRQLNNELAELQKKHKESLESDNQIVRQQAYSIKAKMRQVSADLQNKLAIILDDMMNRNWDSMPISDPSIAVDCEAVLKAHNAEQNLLETVIKKTDADWEKDENILKARRDYLQNHIESEATLHELKKVQDTILDVVANRERLGGVTGLRLMQEQLHTIGMYDTYFVGKIDCDRDPLYLQVVDKADSLNVKDPLIEMMRMNLGNWHSRNNRNGDAIQCYLKAIENMRDTDENAYVIRQYIVHLYITGINALTDLGEMVNGQRLTEQLQEYYSRWEGKICKGEAFVNRVRLLNTKLRRRPIEANPVELYAEAKRIIAEFEDVDLAHLSDFVWGEVFCDFYCCFGSLLIDYPVDKGWFDEALANFNTLLENASSTRLTYEEMLDYSSKAHHNIARVLQQQKNLLSARKECLEALQLRRELYEYTKHDSDKSKVAETLLLLGATYLEPRFKYLSETQTETALGYAEECLSIYESLNSEGYPEQVTDVYKAKLLKASILYDSGKADRREEAIKLLWESFKWNNENPKNSYSDVIVTEASRRLCHAGELKIVYTTKP